MSKHALPCIVCDTRLENVFDDAINQPYKGTTFESTGHYGSTVFDPMDGSHIEINICDDCLKAKRESVLYGRNRKPVMSDGEHVGWTKAVRQLTPWRGDEQSGFDDPTDHLEVDPEEIGSDALPEIDWN